VFSLCAAFVLLALAGGAGAASNPVKRPPSLLWKSYPLKQRTAASPHHLLRPPALAVGTGSSSGDEIVGTPYLVFLALLGGAILALTGLAAKGLIKEGTMMTAAYKRRAAESKPASTEDAKPDMLVALRPTSVTAEEERDLVESQRKTAVVRRPAQIEDEGEVEPGQSEQAPPVPLRPIRAVLRPLLRPIEEQQPQVEAPPAEEEEPESKAQPASAAEAATEPQSEPDSKRRWREASPEVPKHLWREASPQVPKNVWREASPKEDTEVVVEICQIRLWRGYARYRLYAALGRDGVDRALAHTPYFRLKDPEAPSAEAKAAMRDLLDRLEAGGWTIAQEGRPWYSFVLKRPL